MRMVVMVALHHCENEAHCDRADASRVAAFQPVGHRAVVMEAVTEIGVLRPFRRDRVEDVAVDRPPALGLR